MSYEIEHVTSSPHYPQSNGKVENTIKIAKNLLKKSKTAKTDIYLALLEWRNTPSEGLESSPSQRMFGQRTRTLIPATSELLKQKLVDDIPGKLLKKKKLQAKYYNYGAKELPHLSNGEVVRAKPTGTSGQWHKAQVEQQVDVRSYEVKLEDGRAFRRNRRHLRSTKEPTGIVSKPDVLLSIPESVLNDRAPHPSKQSSPTKLSPSQEAQPAKNITKETSLYLHNGGHEILGSALNSIFRESIHIEMEQIHLKP